MDLEEDNEEQRVRSAPGPNTGCISMEGIQEAHGVWGAAGPLVRCEGRTGSPASGTTRALTGDSRRLPAPAFPPPGGLGSSYGYEGGHPPAGCLGPSSLLRPMIRGGCRAAGPPVGREGRTGSPASGTARALTGGSRRLPAPAFPPPGGLGGSYGYEGGHPPAGCRGPSSLLRPMIQGGCRAAGPPVGGDGRTGSPASGTARALTGGSRRLPAPAHPSFRPTRFDLKNDPLRPGMGTGGAGPGTIRGAEPGTRCPGEVITERTPLRPPAGAHAPNPETPPDVANRQRVPGRMPTGGARGTDRKPRFRDDPSPHRRQPQAARTRVHPNQQGHDSHAPEAQRGSIVARICGPRTWPGGLQGGRSPTGKGGGRPTSRPQIPRHEDLRNRLRDAKEPPFRAARFVSKWRGRRDSNPRPPA